MSLPEAQDSVLTIAATNFPSIPDTRSVAEAFYNLGTRNLEYIAVCGKNNEFFSGLITKYDFYRHYSLSSGQNPFLKDEFVSTIVNQQWVTLTTEHLIKDAIQYFSEEQINPFTNSKYYLRYLPVLDKVGNLAGIVSYLDVINFFQRSITDENAPLVKAIASRFNKVLDFKQSHGIDFVVPQTGIEQIVKFYTLTGRRSIPVVSALDSTVLGILDEEALIHLASNSRKQFDSSLAITAYMSPASQLDFALPNWPVTKLFPLFLRKPLQDTIIVVSTKIRKELFGIVSYVDIMKKFKDS